MFILSHSVVRSVRTIHLIAQLLTNAMMRYRMSARLSSHTILLHMHFGSAVASPIDFDSMLAHFINFQPFFFVVASFYCLFSTVSLVQTKLSNILSVNHIASVGKHITTECARARTLSLWQRVCYPSVQGTINEYWLRQASVNFCWVLTAFSGFSWLRLASGSFDWFLASNGFDWPIFKASRNRQKPVEALRSLNQLKPIHIQLKSPASATRMNFKEFQTLCEQWRHRYRGRNNCEESVNLGAVPIHTINQWFIEWLLTESTPSFRNEWEGESVRLFTHLLIVESGDGNNNCGTNKKKLSIRLWLRLFRELNDNLICWKHFFLNSQLPQSKWMSEEFHFEPILNLNISNAKIFPLNGTNASQLPSVAHR